MWRWFGGTTILISSEHFSTISLEDTFGIFFQMHLTRVDGFVRNDWKDITCVCIATVHGEVIRSFFVAWCNLMPKIHSGSYVPRKNGEKSNFWGSFCCERQRKNGPRIESLCAKKLQSLGETWRDIPYTTYTHIYIYIILIQ